jgi:hypothetical protein
MSDKRRKANLTPPPDSTKKDITEDDLHRYARDPESLGYGEASRQRQQEAAERYGTSDPFTIATSDISRFYRETTGKVLGPVQLRQLAKERLGQAGPTSPGRGAAGATGGVTEKKVGEIVKEELKPYLKTFDRLENFLDKAEGQETGEKRKPKEPEEPGYETEEPEEQEEKKAPSPISKGNATKSKPEGKKPENYETKGKDEKAAEEPYDITGKEEVEWKDEKEEGDAKKEYESLRDVIEDMATNAGGGPTPKTKDAIARSRTAAKAGNYKRAMDLLNVAEEDIVEHGMEQRAFEAEEEHDEEFWKSPIGQMYKAAREGKLPELLGRPVPEYSSCEPSSDRTKLILHGKAGDYTVSIDDGPAADATEEPKQAKGDATDFEEGGPRETEEPAKAKKLKDKFTFKHWDEAAAFRDLVGKGNCKIIHQKDGSYNVRIDNQGSLKRANELYEIDEFDVNRAMYKGFEKNAKENALDNMIVENSTGIWNRKAKVPRYVALKKGLAIEEGEAPEEQPEEDAPVSPALPPKIGKGTGKSKKKQPESDEVTFEEIVEEKASEEPPEEDGSASEEVEELPETYDAKPPLGPSPKPAYFAPPPKPGPPPAKVEEEHAEPVEPPGPAESPDVVKVFECGNCGGTVEGEATECPECHAEFTGTETPAEEQHPERGTYQIDVNPGYGGGDVVEIKVDYPEGTVKDIHQVAEGLQELGAEVGGLSTYPLKITATVFKKDISKFVDYLAEQDFNPAGVTDEESADGTEEPPTEEEVGAGDVEDFDDAYGAPGATVPPPGPPEEPSIEKIGPPPLPGGSKSPTKIVEYKPPTGPPKEVQGDAEKRIEGDFEEVNPDETEGPVPAPTMQPSTPPEVPPPVEKLKADDDIDDLLTELVGPPAQAPQGATEVGADKEPETVLQGVGLVPKGTPAKEPTSEKKADMLGDMLKNLRGENGNTVAAGGTVQHPPTNVPPQEQPAEQGKTGADLAKEAMRKAKEKAKKGT